MNVIAAVATIDTPIYFDLINWMIRQEGFDPFFAYLFSVLLVVHPWQTLVLPDLERLNSNNEQKCDQWLSTDEKNSGRK